MGFKLTKGADTFEFDTSGEGSVTKNGSAFGTWATDDHNKVLAKPADGGTPTSFDLIWKFNNLNELCLFNGASQVMNFHADRRPRYDLDKAVLRVRPAFAQPFQFAIRGSWALNPDMTLAFTTVEGGVSVLSGSLSDPKGRFLYVVRSKDPAHGSHQSALLFTGRWAKDTNDATKLDFHFQKEGNMEGTFVLPGDFKFSGGENQLVYSFQSATATHQVTIVGTLRISPSFQLSYSIKNQISQGIVGSEIVIDAVISNRAFDGALQLAVQKPGGGNTVFTVSGQFTHIRLGGTEVGVGFSISGGSGSTPFVVAIQGTFSKTPIGDVTFTFEHNAMFTTISVTADKIKLGAFSANASATVKLRDGSVASVEIMFGVTFPLRSLGGQN